jgi:apolipoprotein D and lipocalin family protein
MKTTPIIPGVALVLLLFASPAPLRGESVGAEGLGTVKSVDMERYVGLWYEIERIPNRFQSNCIGETTASYSLREDGRIDVSNRCHARNGKIIEANGIAKVVDKRSNAKLKVSFVRFLGFNLFWGDYWIIGLGEDYEYAVVGTPSRKYGWILSREPSLPGAVLDRIQHALRQQGYRSGDFEKTLKPVIPE